jgi:Bacterial TSP3 repeat
VALDLPPGSLLEGETALWLRADDTAITSDVNPANNEVSFTVNLFVDSDGDGAPNQWELVNGLNPNDASDASADSDGDGVSNLAEYLSGTDPQSVESYLRLSSIARSPSAGVQITWGSVNGRLYTLLRSAALANGFAPLATHIQSTPPQNVFIDSSATNAGPYFYRLQLE